MQDTEQQQGSIKKLRNRTGFVGSIHTAGQVPSLSPSGSFTRTSTRTPPPSTKLPLACVGGMIWPATGCVRDTTRADVWVAPSYTSALPAICSAVVPPASSSTTFAFSGLHARSCYLPETPIVQHRACLAACTGPRASTGTPLTAVTAIILLRMLESSW